MTNDKHRGHSDQIGDFSGSPAEAHSQSALEQSAHYAAQLAIARWIRTSALSPLPPAAPAQAAQAAWFALAQKNFQEWLGRGGFDQYDTPCTDRAGQSAQNDPSITPVPANGARHIGTCID